MYVAYCPTQMADGDDDTWSDRIMQFFEKQMNVQNVAKLFGSLKPRIEKKM